MMDIESIKIIAESLGLELSRVNNYQTGNDDVYIAKGYGVLERFNPYTNEADAFNVLEALVKRPMGGVVVKYSNDKSLYGVDGTFSESNNCETLKEAICQSYLSLIKEEHK